LWTVTALENLQDTMTRQLSVTVDYDGETAPDEVTVAHGPG